MPISGFTRFRKHQVGKQTSISSNTPATRILPYRGAITLNPNRTDPDVDMGSLDTILAPFNGPLEIADNWTGNLAANDAPYLWTVLKGGVTPTGGTAKTWTFQPASLTADTFEYLTDQWGDDYSTDVINAGSVVLDTLEIGFGDDLSAFDVNADLIGARADFSGFTGGLTADANPVWFYGTDTEIYLDTTAAAIGTTKLVDATHGATVNINNNLDKKRFANGSNTRFQLAGFGRGKREITVTLVVDKTTATVTEAQTIDDTPVPNRFIEIKTTSPEIITGSTPYSQSIRVPVRLDSRADTELNNNSTITLVYKGYYDSTLLYPIKVVVVNTLAAL
jgi:hypothetical protein